MSKVFVNPYSGQSKSWSLQSCWLYLTKGKSDIDTQSGTGILAATESVQIQFQRQINTRYPLMANKAPIKILGVPSGTCTLGTILGPVSGVQGFLQNFGSTCKPFTLIIKQKPSTYSMSGEGQDCEDQTTSHKITLEGCLGTQLSYTVQMQQNIAIAQGQFVITFDNMDWTSGSSAQ